MNTIKHLVIITLFLSFMTGCSFNKPDDYIEVSKVKGETLTVENKIEDRALIKKYDEFFKEITQKKTINKKFKPDYSIVHLYKKKAMAKHHIEIDSSRHYVQADNHIYILSDSEYNELKKLIKK